MVFARILGRGREGGDWRFSGGIFSMGADELPGPVNRLFLPLIFKN
jgi:hypothetical protein